MSRQLCVLIGNCLVLVGDGLLTLCGCGVVCEEDLLGSVVG